MAYEYKVVPAPRAGVKAKGIKTPEDRFAHALQMVMNEQAAQGWDYLRADTLPAEQREGLMGKATVYHNMLVFRREKDTPAQSVAVVAAPAVAALAAPPVAPRLEARPPAEDARRDPPLTPRPPAPATEEPS